MVSDLLGQQIIRALLAFHRRSRELGRQTSLGLKFHEAAALIEIDLQADLSPTKLAQQLAIDPAAAFHLLAFLESAKLIVKRPRAGYQRFSSYHLSEQGSRDLAHWYGQYNALTEQLLSGLRSSSVERLIVLLRRLATGRGARPVSWQLLHPFRVELSVRLGGVDGVYKDRYLGSAWNISQWHVLAILTENGTSDSGRATVSAITRQMPFDKSTVSRTIKALVQQGVLQQQSDPTDGRGRLITLTRQGAIKFKRELAGMVQSYLAGFAGWSAAEVEELLGYLVALGRYPQAVRASPVRIAEVEEESKLQLLRGRVATEFVRLGLAQDVPAELLSARQRVFEVTRENRCIGTVTLRSLAQGCLLEWYPFSVDAMESLPLVLRSLPQQDGKFKLLLPFLRAKKRINQRFQSMKSSIEMAVELLDRAE